MASVDEILQAIKVLPVAEQWSVYGELQDHLEPGDDDPIAVAEAWRAELDRRWEEYKSGKVKGIPCEEVIAKARAEFGIPSDD